MRRNRLAMLIALLLPLAAAGCSDDSTGPAGGITCAATDPFCPPADLAAGFSGAAGAPTITPSTGATTSFSTATTAFAVTGTTSATTNGYWLQVSNGVLTAWGVLAVATGSYAAEVPLVCGTQDIILTFTSGANRSYYHLTVNLTGCVAAAVRVQLTWNTGPSSDMDLHLLRPGGSMFGDGDCYFGNCQGVALEWGAAGAAGNPILDVDDTEGYGPENIYLASGPEAGEFRIIVDNWDGTTATTATVKLFFGDVEVRRWTSLTLDYAANREYWEVAKFNAQTRVITNVNTYAADPPVVSGFMPVRVAK